MPRPYLYKTIQQRMSNDQKFDVIIVGGSYSGLAAAMALGRALKQVLIIDSGLPCNRQTPYSHNFLTQDGLPPGQIATQAWLQVLHYKTIKYCDGLATAATRIPAGFEVSTAVGQAFEATRLIFATGIVDNLPAIEGLSESWGISVLHCPYCHGYEVSYQLTGILANGEEGFQLAALIANWTDKLTLFTNGASTVEPGQRAKLQEYNIPIVEKPIVRIDHTDGYIQNLLFADGSKATLKALYTRPLYEQHSHLPQQLGCELTPDGYLKVDAFQETTVPGIYACGDNSSRTRTIANAVATGTAAGMTAGKKFITENF